MTSDALDTDTSKDISKTDTSETDTSKTSTPEALLQHAGLWRGRELGRARSRARATSSGFADLDRHLQGQGWPAAGLMELLLKTNGIGELRLLAPLLQHLSRTENRWIAWVRPPFIPYAPALEALGIATEKILLIHPRDHRQALWALEQASKSGGCAMALAWLDENQLRSQDTRRLQLAAQQGDTLTCLFRPESAAERASMAQHRLRLAPDAAGCLRVDLIKRRGGWPVSGLQLDLAAADDAGTSDTAGKPDANEATTGNGHSPVERKLREIREQLLLWRHDRESCPATLPETLNTGRSYEPVHVRPEPVQPAIH